MSDAPHPARAPPAAPPLEAPGDVRRAELQRLQSDLATLQQQLGASHAAQLLQANEQLVMAAVRAETIAETATAQLVAMTRLTQRDALTDTPNRSLMLDRLQAALSMARRRCTRCAVLFVDIDHFKHINDGFGHLVGDEVLKRVARHMEQAVRDTDTVSRHSGDEFLVLLAEISKPSDAAQIALHVLEAVAAIHLVDHPALAVTASIGIAIYPEDGRTAINLIDRADAAMYRAKKSGGAMFQVYGAPGAGPAADTPDFLDTSSFETHPMGLDTPSGDGLHSRELRRANEQLVLSSLAAQEAEAQTRQAYLKQVTMLAMVAHELRGPLAPIRNAADMLSRARDDAKKHAGLQEVIKRQVSHMSRIVNDLLDGSRAETGKFHLELADIDLTDILRAAADACQPVMHTRHQRLRMHLPKQPLRVHGDAVRLTQVFRNLLDNAAKYTPENGQVILTAAAIEDSIVTTVSDTGIGIGAEALPRVFDLFKQDSRAVAMHRGGLGIGLAVVRELVEAHGGTVTASSPGQDKGSVFVVKLPLAAKQG